MVCATQNTSRLAESLSGALDHDEEVDGVAGSHKAVGVQHEPFVGARLVGSHAASDAVELAVRVEGLVLHVRRATAHVHCVQPDALQGMSL